MAEILIREYHPQDLPRLSAIHDPARMNELELAGLKEAFLPLEIAAQRENLFQYQLVIAELDGLTAGFVAYTGNELAWLYVDPACARRGVGRRLAEYALAHMQRPATIEVLVGNTPAKSLYEQCGFRLVETVSGRMPGNEAYPVTVHVLQLD